MHVKDFDPAVWGTKPRRYLLPGEGALDIDGFLDRLPYDGTLTLEMSAVGANGEIDADRLEAAVAWLRRLVPMSRRVAILGCGKIGESLLAGLLSAGVARRRTRSSRPRAARRARRRAPRPLRDRGHARERARPSAGAGLVVLAVKPQDIESLLGEIGPLLSPEQTVLSVAAAIRPRGSRAGIAAGVPVVRAMPNAPVGRPRGDRRDLRRRARHARSTSRSPRSASRTSGAVVRVPEPYMDAVTAVSGSGPAYFALLAEAMIEAGLLLGLSREVTTQLVVQTMLGTAKLLRDERIHPVELREAVTSPGGTTIHAIRELERAGVRAAFLNAIQAAMERSQELAEDGG